MIRPPYYTELMHARDRLPFGQLLVRSLRIFRRDLFQNAEEAGYTDIREAHLQVFGVIDRSGTRLTDLAARANMTNPSMAELVDQLEEAAYLERRPDPSDGRAKLICLTERGKETMREALKVVGDLEHRYGSAVGVSRFEAACQTLQDLIDHFSEDTIA